MVIPRGMGRPGTGIMIRDYLRNHPVAYVMQIWREGVVEPCKEQGFKYPCWADFCNYFSKVKKCGLVLFDHYEEGEDLTGSEEIGVTRRNFYRLNLGMDPALAERAWNNPIEYLYGYQRRNR